MCLKHDVHKTPGAIYTQSQTYAISLWDIRFLPTRSVFTFFQTFLNFWSNAPKCRHLGGGVLCMLFEICEKTPFQKCLGWGGIFLSTEAEPFGVSGFSGLMLLRSRVQDTNSQVFPWVLRHILELEQSERR